MHPPKCNHEVTKTRSTHEECTQELSSWFRVCSENALDSTTCCGQARGGAQAPFSCYGVSPAHDDFVAKNVAIEREEIEVKLCHRQRCDLHPGVVEAGASPEIGQRVWNKGCAGGAVS